MPDRKVERFSDSEFNSALGLVRDCDRATDLPDFRARVVGVAELIGCDVVAYSEADLVAGTIEGKVQPDWLQEERWHRAFERHAHEHPVIAHMAETGDLSPRAVSDMLSERQLHATGLYREFWALIGTEDQISFGLPSSPRMVLRIAMNRPARGFSAGVRALLALIAPHLGDAYLAARARTVVSAGAEAAPSGEHLIVLDADDSVTAVVGSPETILGVTGSPLAPGEPLPAELASWIDDSGAGRRRVGAGIVAPSRAEGAGVAIRGFDGGYPGAARILELTELREAIGPELAAELELTPREREVANVLAEGLSDQQIADRLSISPHTVKRHLEHVYAKLEVGSRAAALARLLSP